MTDSTFFITILLILGTILIIFAMRYFSSMQQARSRIASDNAYRDVAEKAVTAQSEISAALADIRARLASVETILKEVG
jgi:signal transduction histidine kinase